MSTMVTERLVSALVLSAASRREVVEPRRKACGIATLRAQRLVEKCGLRDAARTLSASHYLLQKIIDKNTEIYIC